MLAAQCSTGILRKKRRKKPTVEKTITFSNVAFSTHFIHIRHRPDVRANHSHTKREPQANACVRMRTQKISPHQIRTTQFKITKHQNIAHVKTKSKHSHWIQTAIARFGTKTVWISEFSTQMNCNTHTNEQRNRCNPMKLKRSKQSIRNTIVQSIYFKVHFFRFSSIHSLVSIHHDAYARSDPFRLIVVHARRGGDHASALFGISLAKNSIEASAVWRNCTHNAFFYFSFHFCCCSKARSARMWNGNDWRAKNGGESDDDKYFFVRFVSRFFRVGSTEFSLLFEILVLYLSAFSAAKRERFVISINTYCVIARVDGQWAPKIAFHIPSVVLDDKYTNKVLRLCWVLSAYTTRKNV